MPDFSMTGMLPPEQADAAPDNLAAASSATGGYLKGVKDRAQDAEKVSQVESNFNAKTGTWSLENVPHEALQTIIRNSQRFGQIQQIYAQQIEQNQRQQDQMRAHPFANAMAQIAASIGASSKDPLVRGLGDAAQRLNPTLAELQNRQAGLAKGMEGAVEGQSRIASGLLTHAQTAQYHRDQIESKNREDRGRIERDAGITARKGEFDPESYIKELVSAGESPERAAAAAGRLEATSNAAKSRLDAEAKAKEKKEADTKAASDKRLEQGERRLDILTKAVAEKNAEKSSADKAIEETAKSIAAGDLSSIRDISSFRGSERTKIYARAKEINPNFSVAETQRKIDMEKSFTVGKDGLALQSFGTFLEHAGEVKTALDSVYQSGSPAFNKPMNWWRKNMSGSPEYQKLLTSLEPVKKEFESFLLSGRAMYADDRKQAEVLLNGNSTPAQIASALSQMGKTAKDRYTEMNHRYKRVMGRDLENPFGEEAAQGAKKAGIDLGGGSKKYPWEK
jgi:hypothetical protein